MQGLADVTIINIFHTQQLEGASDDFVHDAFRFVFERIGPEGPRRLIEGPIWIFIDWVMDDLAGLELCRRLRADPRTSEAHVTMVLESDDDEERRRALRAGADDYIVGRLDRTRILDRVLAVLSDGPDANSAHLIELGNLTIDMIALQARWSGKPLRLGPNEFRLIRYFAENPDRVLSRQDLINGLGKREPAIDERTVDVWVGRLRRAIRAGGGGNPLRTVRSLGYVFDSH